MASRSDIDERLSPQDAADDYLAKPFFLKEATRRIKRTVDRIALEKMAKTAPSDGVVRGQPFADECDRPDAVARNGPQELPAQAEQSRAISARSFLLRAR